MLARNFLCKTSENHIELYFDKKTSMLFKFAFLFPGTWRYWHWTCVDEYSHASYEGTQLVGQTHVEVIIYLCLHSPFTSYYVWGPLPEVWGRYTGWGPPKM